MIGFSDFPGSSAYLLNTFRKGYHIEHEDAFLAAPPHRTVG